MVAEAAPSVSRQQSRPVEVVLGGESSPQSWRYRLRVGRDVAAACREKRRRLPKPPRTRRLHFDQINARMRAPAYVISASADTAMKVENSHQAACRRLAVRAAPPILAPVAS